MAEKANIDTIKTKLDDYLDLLRENDIKFDKVFLYGSYVRGNPRADSDIDLAIVAEKWEPDIFEAQFLLMKIARKVDSRIEPRPIRKSDFIDPDPFISEIISTGKVIYS